MPEPRRARAALLVVFFILGGLAGAWAARIPAIKGSLHLSSGSLGVALLGSAVGLVASTAPTGWALTHVRPRPVIAVGLCLYAASLPVTVLAGGTMSLFGVLLVWGFGAGMIDVAMNTEGAALQVRLGRPIMSGLHAGYSIGALAGAGTGALAAGLGVSVGPNLIAAGIVTGALGLAAVVALGDGAAPLRAASDNGRPTRHLPRPSWGLAALAALAFGGFLAEGAINDWSAVYLHSSLGTSAGVAALGYTVFAVAMVAGRLTGDRLGRRLGPTRLVRSSASVAAIAFAVSLIVARPVVSLIGFAVLGLGLATVVPLAFSAASRQGSPGPSLALVTGCGYLGLMAGPPLIGGTAELVGLPSALAIVVAVTVVAAILAPSLSGDSQTTKGGGSWRRTT